MMLILVLSTSTNYHNRWTFILFSMYDLHTKIHLINPGYPQPSIALQVQNHCLNTIHFSFNSKIHLINPGYPQPGVALQYTIVA